MLESFDDDPVVAEVLNEASAALGQDLAALIKQGPADALSLTVNTQPVMLTAGYAMYRAWRAAGGPAPAVVAGHSLGEYTALVAAGALALGDAVRLVRFRAQAMQEAVPVGRGRHGRDPRLERRPGASGVRDGGRGRSRRARELQCTVAGRDCRHATAVATRVRSRQAPWREARAVCCRFRRRFIRRCCRPAAIDCARYLATRRLIKTPTIPLVNNVDVAIETEPARVRRCAGAAGRGAGALGRNVQKLAADGVTHVVECGPGRVLAGLTKRIVPELESHCHFDAESVKDALARLAA